MALVIALTPLGHAFNFVTIPPLLLLTIGMIVLVYLSVAEAIKTYAQRAVR